MPRKVRVATVCMGGRCGPTVERNMELVMGLLDLACRGRPDVVCLPENFGTAGVGGTAEERAEPVPGPTTDACAERARRHRTYVICPLITRRDGVCYNSAVFVDRSGEVAGVYDKVHPVTTKTGEHYVTLEGGVTPGREARVLELDFGRVGCQICFDINFSETWQALADEGAEIVFWPSAFTGGMGLRAYAWLHGYYVVSSVRSASSVVVGPLGEVLARTDHRQRVASRPVDLDAVVCHTDFNGARIDDMIRAYGEGVTVRVHDEGDVMMVESNDDALAASKLVEEYGLIPLDEYRARHREVYRGMLRAGGQATG